MHRPIIGLTCNELDKENLPKQFINEAYIHSVIRAGGCPVILPITNDYDTIQAQVNLLDGLIVTGGIDVNPMTYNENPEPLQGNSSLDRDYYEMRVLKYANEKQIPIFGICRGIQMLNVYFKGSLYQDLSYCKRSVIKHAQQEKRENPIPVMISAAIIITIPVFSPININIAVPIAQNPIPMEDSLKGENLSDIRPITGERTAIITGCEIITSPAV